MARLAQGVTNPGASSSLTPPPRQGSTRDTDWLGLPWMSSQRDAADPGALPGVYQLKSQSEVVYLGQSSNLQARLRAHYRSTKEWTEAAWVVMPDAPRHHRLERETDLIGAFFLEHRRPPKYQYSSP